MSSRATRPNRAAIAIAGATMLLAAVMALAIGIGRAGAVGAKVIGEGGENTKPTCPKRDCNATGAVTGYQLTFGGKRGVFKVPSDGKLVAWSIELARPDNFSRDFFEENLSRKGYGGDPYARIGILKKVQGKQRNSFKLAKQTPAVDLKRSLGKTPIFTLGKPLNIKKGQVVALSVPTWATNFVAGDGSKSTWRASRKPDRCDLSSADNRAASKPQMRKGTTKVYGCKYTGERLLYKAYYTPDKGSGGDGGE